MYIHYTHVPIFPSFPWAGSLDQYEGLNAGVQSRLDPCPQRTNEQSPSVHHRLAPAVWLPCQGCSEGVQLLLYTRPTGTFAQSADRRPRSDSGLQYRSLQAGLLQRHPVRCASHNLQHTVMCAEHLARVVCQCGGQTGSLLQLLHGLPVRWVTYKMVSLTFKVSLSSTPAYLSDLIQIAVPVRLLQSSDAPLLTVPKTQTSLAWHAFSYHMCNNLELTHYLPFLLTILCRQTNDTSWPICSEILNLRPPAPLHPILGLQGACNAWFIVYVK